MSRAPRTEFRSRPWLRLTACAVCALFVAGFVFSYLREGWSWVAICFAALTGLGVAAIGETLVVRVSLLSDAALLVSIKGRQLVPKESIVSVTWESGAGVALKLRDGSWVKLPELGHNSQGLTNSIRAWLARPPVSEGRKSRRAAPPSTTPHA